MTSDLAYAKRWRADRHAGVDRGYTPVTALTGHVQALLAAGATYRGIARAAGVSTSTILGIATGVRDGNPMTRVQQATAARVARVTLHVLVARPDRDGLVPAVGSRRRIRALMATGWTHDHITAAMNTAGSGHRSAILLHQGGDRVTAGTAAAVAAAYDDLAMRLGPSARTRTRAATSGYPPPLAWDDDSIDDPTATPAGIVPPCGRLAGKAAIRALVEDVEELAGHRETVPAVAARLGMSEATLARALYRAGRGDLITLMQGNAGRVAS